MHVRRTLALALAVPLFLAGCSEKAEPTPKMPDPTESSSTPSPTESSTAQAESAEDFIRRWVEVDRSMQNTGETDEYAKLSSKCKTCMSVAERVEGIFDAGGFVKTDGLRILKVVDQSGPVGRKVFDVRVRSSPTVLKESEDGAEQRLPGGTLTYRMRLSPQAPWQLVQLTQLAS
jgi:hypothetical protein